MKTQNVKSLTWTDSRFKKLSRDGKLLWLYFMTSERSNMAGVFESSTDLIFDETGLDSAEFSAALKELAINRMSWHSNNYVILKNRWQYNNLENSKIVKGISNTIVDIPDSVKIFILELDNELTWAIDTVFNVNLKLSKKERYYLSYVQEHNRSHAKKADSSHLNSNSNSNSNLDSNLHRHDENENDDLSKILKIIKKEYNLFPADIKLLEKIGKTPEGVKVINDTFDKVLLSEKEIENPAAYFITSLKKNTGSK